MLKIENYEFAIADDPDNEGVELLLMTVEREDIPENYGFPQRAKIVESDGQKSIWVDFDGREGLTVEFAGVPSEAFSPLDAFEVVTLGIMQEGYVLEEYTLTLQAASKTS